jgi:2-polyprenyl-6-methoxyphenol hydroxylase-like FAD-dependent oxidoreductase
MSGPKRKAVIIGCGAAGPTLALFLKRAGIESEIYEARSEAESSTGWFLNLAGNGIGVLQTLGIADVISAEGSPAPRMVMWSGEGKRLGEVRNGAREGLTESVIIRRGALQRCLNEAAMAASIPIHFEKKLRSVETTDGQGVVATFEDGATARGDFLNGADGIHSRVRALISPNAPAPSYTGLVSTGGFTTHLSLPPTPKTQYFIFGKRAFFGYHVRASGEIYWFNYHARARAPGRGELTQFVSEDWKQRLLEMHRGDVAPVEDIIRAIERATSAHFRFTICPRNHSGIAGRSSWWATPYMPSPPAPGRGPRWRWKTPRCWPRRCGMRRVWTRRLRPTSGCGERAWSGWWRGRAVWAAPNSSPTRFRSSSATCCCPSS